MTSEKEEINAFIDTISNENIKNSSKKLIELMKNKTNFEPKLWGKIIGFGDYHYKYESGREGHTFFVGFSPKKNNITIYFVLGFDKFEEVMKNLGKYKTGKSCMYINKMEDIDIDILGQMIEKSIKID